MFANRWTNCIFRVEKVGSLSQSNQDRSPLLRCLLDSDRWDLGAESSALQPPHLSDKHLISVVWPQHKLP